jgi:hypothetical protein
MRFAFCSFLGALALVSIVGCNREESTTTKTTDSSAVAARPSESLPVTDSSLTQTPSEAAPHSSAQTTTPDASAASGDTIHSRVLSDDDPIAKKMLEAMKGRPPGYRPQPGTVVPRNVIPAERLSELQPKIPGYTLVEQPSNFDGQGQGRSTALLRSTADPGKTIRVIIKSEDETMASSFAQKLSELKRAGSLTDYSQGEPITAYYLQVGGQPAARAYIPSKHVATLTVFVGDHRLIQLREDKVNSADHLVQVSQYVDVKRLASLKP